MPRSHQPRHEWDQHDSNDRSNCPSARQLDHLPFSKQRVVFFVFFGSGSDSSELVSKVDTLAAGALEEALETLAVVQLPTSLRVNPLWVRAHTWVAFQDSSAARWASRSTSSSEKSALPHSFGLMPLPFSLDGPSPFEELLRQRSHWITNGGLVFTARR